MSGLNWWDRLIASVSPAAGVKRAHARQILAHYEGAEETRLRKVRRQNQSGDTLTQRDAVTLRAQARYQECNHDLARGILNVMVRNIIGPKGIGIEPHPRDAGGAVHDAFAKDLINAYRTWCTSPDVTGGRDMAEDQRQLCRHWLRDGEVFVQMLSGPVGGLRYDTPVPMALELLEADFCPYDYEQLPNIRQGIEINAFRRPRAYWMYRDHPGDYRTADVALKRVSADSILHLRLCDRLTQLRGVSIFASILTRIDDLKDYENSERIAAKIAASMAAYIRKGQPDAYNDADALDESGKRKVRELNIEPGAIFDDLLPGEEVGVIKSDRPNSGLEGFRTGQGRAIASGADVGFSSVFRNYDGTYSAQRQELVEQYSAYLTFAELFISQFMRPMWQRFVTVAIASGLVVPPAGVKPETWAQAEFIPPTMPWIDPLKEALGIEKMLDLRLTSRTHESRKRQTSFGDLVEIIARERAAMEAKGIPIIEGGAIDGADPASNTDDAPPGRKAGQS